jgi:hypothetical protein
MARFLISPKNVAAGFESSPSLPSAVLPLGRTFRALRFLATEIFATEAGARRVHHQFRHHTNNFADIPIWDMLLGTFKNPKKFKGRCGYESWREDRFEDMLVFRDVHAPWVEKLAPLHFLPTCIGCSKRWACTASRQMANGTT